MLRFTIALLISVSSFAQSSAPAKSELHLKGLRQPVEVLRDRWGVNHIYAKNEHDLFFAQGYVAAKDRLFQMELWKRTGQGRLAELLGPSAVARDVNARLLRYRGPMKAEFESYSPDAQQILEAFTGGINAYIDSLHGKFPQEFVLAKFAPEHWKPEDCLSRNAAYSMTGNAESELLNAELATALGEKKARALLDLDPPVELDHFEGVNYAGLSPKLLGEIVSSDRRIQFPLHESNNWTVSGKLTASGRAILANDPHRTIALPSLRYIVHLVAPGWDVIGSGEPALPGVAIGHNQHVAWGLTIFAADQQDLYLETLDPKNPLRYKTESGWQPMKVVREIIHVRGKPDVKAELKFTRHGPVIWEDAATHRALALKWIGSEPGTAGYLASLALDRSEDWPGFRAALQRWKLPPENFVYADDHGNIGEQSAGLVPYRAPRWTGLLPVPGDRGFEWKGWRALNDLPHSLNPEQDFIGTANHRIIPEDDPNPVAYQWSRFRIDRIREFLSGARDSQQKLEMKDIEALQTDVTSVAALEWQKLLRAAAEKDPDAAKRDPGVQLLLNWDRLLTIDSSAAALYEMWQQELRRIALAEIAHDEIRDDLNDALGTAELLNYFKARTELQRNSDLLQALYGCQRFLFRIFKSPMPTRWSWGRLHQVLFRHPLDQLPGANGWDLGPFPRPGDENTVNSTGGPGFSQTSGASYREIFDVGAWDNSLAVNTPGQSGQPGSAHYSDLLPLWLKGEYFPLSYSREAVEKNAESTLELRP